MSIRRSWRWLWLMWKSTRNTNSSDAGTEATRSSGGLAEWLVEQQVEEEVIQNWVLRENLADTAILAGLAF